MFYTRCVGLARCEATIVARSHSQVANREKLSSSKPDTVSLHSFIS